MCRWFEPGTRYIRIRVRKIVADSCFFHSSSIHKRFHGISFDNGSHEFYILWLCSTSDFLIFAHAWTRPVGARGD